MKLKKIIPSLLVLLLLPSCGYNEMYENQRKMKDIYYSLDHIFASPYQLYGKNFEYNIINKINQKFSEIKKEKIEEIDIEAAGQIQDKMIYIINNKENNKDKYYLMSFDVYDYNVEIIFTFDLQTFINLDFIDNEYEYLGYSFKFISSIDNEIKFSVYYNGNNKHYDDRYIVISYNINTNVVLFEKSYSTQVQKNDLIEERYEIIEGNPINSYFEKQFIIVGNDNYNWRIDENVLLTDANYQLIRETIYQEQIMDLEYIIANKRLYFTAAYYNGGGFAFMEDDKSKNTVKLVFEANINEESVEYLGYISPYASLTGVFDKTLKIKG